MFCPILLLTAASLTATSISCICSKAHNTPAEVKPKELSIQLLYALCLYRYCITITYHYLLVVIDHTSVRLFKTIKVFANINTPPILIIIN